MKYSQSVNFERSIVLEIKSGMNRFKPQAIEFTEDGIRLQLSITHDELSPSIIHEQDSTKDISRFANRSPTNNN